jgi:hypothetical protein
VLASLRAGAALAPFAIPFCSAAAQGVHVEARQPGSSPAAYTQSLTVAVVPSALEFRWWWSKTGTIDKLKAAVWQVSYAATPSPEVDPPRGTIAKQGVISWLPSAGAPAPFTIRSADLPSNRPSTFHVRVKASPIGPVIVSKWVRVYSAQQLLARGGGAIDVARASTEDKPMLIPAGGGAGLATPIWIDAGRVTALEAQESEDEIDAYVAVVNTKVSSADPSAVRIFSRHWTDMGDNDYRVLNYRLWGTAGNAAPLPSATDLVVLAFITERDSDPFTSFPQPLKNALTTELARIRDEGLAPDLMAKRLSAAAFISVLKNSPHGLIGIPEVVPFTNQDLASARAGHPVTREIVLGQPDGNGRYRLAFTVGR